MQGKVVLIGSKAVTAYYIALGFLIGLLLVIIIGVLMATASLPPCTTVIAKNVCGVNDWSIAGLAATILGVGATVLAFLGAFAVAAWWKDLNKVVDERVDGQVTKRMEELQHEQERKFREEVRNLFNQEKAVIDTLLLEKDRVITDLQRQAKVLLDLAMRPGIQEQNQWVMDYWALYRDEFAQVIVKNMILRHLRTIDVFRRYPAKQQLMLDNGVGNPAECFGYAQSWQDQMELLDSQVNPPKQPPGNPDLHAYVISNKHEMDKRKQFVEDWKTQHP